MSIVWIGRFQIIEPSAVHYYQPLWTLVGGGVFDREAGTAFRENILERGGSDDAMNLFVSFRGREPEIDALLRHSGLAA